MTGKYLGLDLSTQQIKAVVTNEDLVPQHEVFVSFDDELPHFKTKGGVWEREGGSRVTSPVHMWIQAMDLLLQKLKAIPDLDLSSIVAISGAGQQHGSVYWKEGAESVLKCLDSSRSLDEQLKGAFAWEEGPIWMDSSTEAQCQKLEDGLGGPVSLAKLTGSRAYHRFTGNQIAKVCQETPEIYNSTEGCISEYFVNRFGFSKTCQVVTFTGDNPASMAGMIPRKGDVMVSLGTSDTVLVWLEEASPGLGMHVLCNPVEKEAYMGMLCFKNGAFTRNRIKKETGCEDWDSFNSLLTKTPPGNNGNIGFFFDYPEILPKVPAGDHRVDSSDQKVSKFNAETEARAVLEHQCLAKRIHAEKLGFRSGGRVLVTGGASNNASIIQILSDVFNSPAYTLPTTNSAALGSAFRAKHGLASHGTSLSDICGNVIEYTLAASPNPASVETYKSMASRYAELEKRLEQN